MMRVVGIQLSHIALLNFLIREQNNDEPFGILDIGARHTELVVCNPGVNKTFGMRPINLSGNNLTEIIAERKRLSFYEAEQEKLSGLASGDGSVNDALKPIMTNLIAEVQRSLGYFRTQMKDTEVERIYLTGRGIGFDVGLSTFKKAIGKQVKIIEAPNQLAFKLAGSPEIFFEDCRQLGVAFGLGLQGMGESEFNTNLLPPNLQFDNILAEKRVTVSIALIAIWVALLISFIYMGSQLGNVISQEKTLTEAIKEIDSTSKKHDAILAEIAPLALKAKNLASFSTGKLEVLQTLNKIYSSLERVRENESGVLLSSLKIYDSTDEALNNWALSLPTEYSIKAFEHIIPWKAGTGKQSEDIYDIINAVEPCRIPKMYSCILKGVAPIGEGVEKLAMIEKFKSELESGDTLLSDVTLPADWKEIDKELPDGTTAKYIEFKISFNIKLKPFDEDWMKKDEAEELMPEELQ